MNKRKFKELIASSGSYRFLGAPYGYWYGRNEKGEDTKIWIEDMPVSYRKNCIKYLEDQRSAIEKGNFLANVDYEDSDYDVLLKLGCEALEEKLQQLSFE